MKGAQGFSMLFLFAFAQGVEVVDFLNSPFQFSESDCSGDASFSNGVLVTIPEVCVVKSNLADFGFLESELLEIGTDSIVIQEFNGSECSGPVNDEAIFGILCVPDGQGGFSSSVADIPQDNLVGYNSWYVQTGEDFNCDTLSVGDTVVPFRVSSEFGLAIALKFDECFNFEESSSPTELKSMRLSSSLDVSLFSQEDCQGSQLDGDCFKVATSQNGQYDIFVQVQPSLGLSLTSNLVLTMFAMILLSHERA